MKTTIEIELTEKELEVLVQILNLVVEDPSDAPGFGDKLYDDNEEIFESLYDMGLIKQYWFIGDTYYDITYLGEEAIKKLKNEKN